MRKLGNPLARATSSRRSIAPAAVSVVGEGQAKVLAMECWRLRKLIPEFAANRKHLVLETSIDRMIEALKASGVAIDDPEGTEFREGMTLNVAAFDTCESLASGKRMISETLSPNIYIHEKLAIAARVIVQVGSKECEHDA